MDYIDYQRNVLARASTEWHGDKVDMHILREVLQGFIRYGNRLDRAKKALFYGRPYSELVDPSSPPLEVKDEQEHQIIHAVLGFATEGVEMIEALYKRIFEGQSFDVVNLQEEFGDGEWYRALFLHAARQTHTANLKQNDSKLEVRYGPVFSAEKANNRDLGTERKTLEG